MITATVPLSQSEKRNSAVNPNFQRSGNDGEQGAEINVVGIFSALAGVCFDSETVLSQGAFRQASDFLDLHTFLYFYCTHRYCFAKHHFW